ncbi:HAD hydrolase-like protein [Streptomyces sp. RB6PN25]|uniref:HAD hydrolase-like protein n=1 Tax=Streptomyces humicola TaxID=2953240 RepID=A0ABT1PQL8_9ACTN|nr:HAD family hydrolase [Streptomyces humicola]MCQ4079968.1 HAD hydrolase-like protein [Streptomyces humicola]
MTLPPPVPSDIRVLRDLIRSAKCILFDFDGPLARLFAGLPAPRAAQMLKERLDRWRLLPVLPDAVTECDDPIQVLRDTAAALRGSVNHDRIAALEELLTGQELLAVRSAVPTPYADPLVGLLAARSRVVAVTTNNSPLAASSYLRARGLDGYFGRHIHGRTSDPAQMKPDPFCLEQALETTGAGAADCLMIGDSPDDYTAALRAGVTFLGYARNDTDRAAQLHAAGARHVVLDLETLHQAALTA